MNENFKCKYNVEIDKERFYNKFGFEIDGIAMFNKDWQDDNI